MKKNIRIAVTGLNAGDNPGPGVPVIRGIRAAGEFSNLPGSEIVGLTYDPLDPGIFLENICDHAYLMPYPSEGAFSLLERIKEIHAKTPLDVIIPTLDSELAAFITIEQDMAALGIKSFLPSKSALELRSKARFSELSTELNIPVPRGQAISDPSVLRTIDKDFNFPIMIKGQFYDAYVAYSPMEAEHFFRKISSEWGLPIIIQEFIVGDEYDVAALGDGSGKCIGAVPMKKLQLTEKGKAWGGVTILDPEMNHFVKEIMAKIKWKGPCELEIMKSKKDNSFYLLEINPRFPAWCFLAVGAGQNLQWATVKLALGEPVSPFENYSVGTMFIRSSIDHIYPLSDYREITTSGELHRPPARKSGGSDA
ncbi:MAG: ATP-grasp domain-containing protein [bacterium]|nr:ATP-grasp domain-containing protein [bacterium]